jgi:hypothetical protein
VNLSADLHAVEKKSGIEPSINDCPLISLVQREEKEGLYVWETAKAMCVLFT